MILIKMTQTSFFLHNEPIYSCQLLSLKKNIEDFSKWRPRYYCTFFFNSPCSTCTNDHITVVVELPMITLAVELNLITVAVELPLITVPVKIHTSYHRGFWRHANFSQFFKGTAWSLPTKGLYYRPVLFTWRELQYHSKYFNSNKNNSNN